MSGFILDTSVLSAFAPGRPAISATALSWFADRDDRLHMSAVVIAEITQGISKLSRLGAQDRAEAFGHWLDDIIEQFGDRVLPFDEQAARLAGELSDRVEAIGRHPGFADVAIAATGAAHDMVVLTRNVRHFEPLGISVADPFAPDFPVR